jgi:hypothetical protein
MKLKLKLLCDQIGARLLPRRKSFRSVLELLRTGFQDVHHGFGGHKAPGAERPDCEAPDLFGKSDVGCSQNLRKCKFWIGFLSIKCLQPIADVFPKGLDCYIAIRRWESIESPQRCLQQGCCTRKVLPLKVVKRRRHLNQSLHKGLIWLFRP